MIVRVKQRDKIVEIPHLVKERVTAIHQVKWIPPHANPWNVIERLDAKERSAVAITVPIAIAVAVAVAAAVPAVIAVAADSEEEEGEDSGEVVADANGGGATPKAKSDLPLRGPQTS